MFEKIFNIFCYSFCVFATITIIIYAIGVFKSEPKVNLNNNQVQEMIINGTRRNTDNLMRFMIIHRIIHK